MWGEEKRQVCRCDSVTLASGRSRWEDQEFRVILGYTMSLGLAWDM